MVLTSQQSDQAEDTANNNNNRSVSPRRVHGLEEDEVTVRHVTSMEDLVSEKNKEKNEKKISAEISVMQPILRFLQLLCENHNRDLQVRTQYRPSH